MKTTFSPLQRGHSLLVSVVLLSLLGIFITIALQSFSNHLASSGHSDDGQDEVRPDNSHSSAESWTEHPDSATGKQPSSLPCTVEN